MADSRCKDKCSIDMLSQDLLTLILRKACEKPVKSYPSLQEELPKIDANGTWLSSSAWHQLKTVCRRFRNLAHQDAPQNLVWELNSAKPVAAAAVLSQLGGHIKGLTLSYVHEWREEIPGGASIEFLTAVLMQAPNLSSFVLNSSEIKQSNEACHHLFGLIARLPLQTLWLTRTEFPFTQPLVTRQQFCELLQVRLAHSKLSDQFLHSLLERSPKLKELCLEECPGLEEPRFKAPSLLKLVLQDMQIDNSEVVVDAPTLTTLKGLPRLRRLDLHAPKLESLWLEGPVEVLETPACKIRLSSLGLSGTNWRIDVVMGLLERFGASKRFNLQVESWHEESEGESLVNLMTNIPRTVEWLSLGIAALQLYTVTLSEVEQHLLQFKKLKFIQFTLTGAEDFKLFCSIMSCCPNLEKTLVNLDNLEKPIEGLVTRAVDFQRAYPGVNVEYKEPPQFVLSTHLLLIANTPGKHVALLDELQSFLYQ